MLNHVNYILLCSYKIKEYVHMIRKVGKNGYQLALSDDHDDNWELELANQKLQSCIL